MPGRPLSERITIPGNRARSLSPRRNLDMDDEEAARRGVDRYRPGGKSSGSRSPMPGRRREGGRRPGARREGGTGGGRGGGGDRGRGGREGRDGRPKKTEEELDAEMASYFNPGQAGDSTTGASTDAAAPAGAPAVQDGDIDMIE